MVGKILSPKSRTWSKRGIRRVARIFSDWPPADLAEVILDLPETIGHYLPRLPAELAADVFEYLDVEAQQELLSAMAHEQVAGILNEMSPDDRTALLEELPSAAARQLIKLLTPEERRVATRFSDIPKEASAV